MNEEKLFIVIPAYNEEENIKALIDDWYPVIEAHNGSGSSRLVIIDDGSKDNTYSALLECAKEKPLLKVITKKNAGHGATVLYGYRYALSEGADYIFQTDSDGQTLSGEFETFWDQKDAYDMVIGYRGNREDGFSRIVVTRVLRLVIRMCFGVFVKDANTPFRLMKRKGLEENIQYIPKDFNLSNVVLSVLYEKRKQKVKYIPITFRPRQGGVNSINLKKISKIGKQAISDFRSINKALKEVL